VNNATPLIPPKSNSLIGNEDIDWCIYQYLHSVENAFGRIKQFRGIATRYEKLEQNYHSMVALAFSIMYLPMWLHHPRTNRTILPVQNSAGTD
jgi:hypothetical protein